VTRSRAQAKKPLQRVLEDKRSNAVAIALNKARARTRHCRRRP
jgi:hypothetical protein